MPAGTSSARKRFRVQRVATVVLAAFSQALMPVIASAGAWNGGTGDWFDGGNWDPAGVPAGGDDVFVDNGGTAQIDAPGSVFFGGYIGNTAGNSGAVEVDGAGPLNGAILRIGEAGSGRLDIAGGGNVTINTSEIGFAAGSTGEVTVSGANSEWYLGTTLRVGNSGAGTLDIAAGGSVDNGRGDIGHAAGSTGSVTVDGAGSEWVNRQSLVVGGNGSGALDITGGGRVQSRFAIIGRFDGSTGAVSLSGPGSSMHISETLFTIGDIGTGTLDVFDGGLLETSSVYIGNEASGTGAVSVDGEGSLWSASSTIHVGNFGTGTLDITGGGEVASWASYIGTAGGGSGAATVEGAGSSWTTNASIVVGNFGVGTLGIAGGGSVSSSQAVIGDEASAEGAVTVAGEDSSLSATFRTIVANYGSGTLVATGGARISNETGYIGFREASSGTVTIDGAASVWTNSDGLYVGASGSGVLGISGGGTVEVAGGGGTVTVAESAGSAGTLNIGAASGGEALAAGTLDAASLLFGAGTGRLVFNHTDDGYLFAAGISGAGELRVEYGFTVLTGDSSAFTGSTFLDGGVLAVNGILGGTMNVGAAALGGSGTLGTTTLGAGAAVMPGNSIGTLNIAGDFTFDADSTYEVETDPASTASDLIHVTGTAYLNGASVRHIGLAGAYQPFSTYTILTADTGIDGTFGAVASDFAFLDAVLDYDPNNVYLQLSRNNIDFGDVASTPNQKGVARALQNFGPGHPLYDEIVTMTDEEARAAYDALTGEGYASAATSQYMTTDQIRQHLLDRLAALSGSGAGGVAALAGAPAAGDGVPGGVAVWGQAFGSRGSTDADNFVAAIDRDIYGFIGGADREIAPGLRAGVAAGYSRSSYDVSARSSSGDSDNFHVAAYAGKRHGNIGLKGILSYGYGRTDASRRVIVGGVTNNLSASYDTHTFQAAAEAGYDIALGGATLTPFAGLAGVHVETGSFTETGGPAALTFASSENSTGISTLGLSAVHEWGGVALAGSAAWRHAFGDIEPAARAAFASAPAASFTVRGTPLAEDTLALGGTLRLQLGEGTTVAFGYSGEIASGTRDHGASAELRFEF